MEYVSTDMACKPAGHYSQAVVHNGLVYVSGQLAVDREGRRHFDSVERETEVALANLDEILKASGSRRGLVLKTTVYVSDISLWDRVNRVEIEAVAAVEEGR